MFLENFRDLQMLFTAVTHLVEGLSHEILETVVIIDGVNNDSNIVSQDSSFGKLLATGWTTREFESR
jgi:hypothetical protein